MPAETRRTGLAAAVAAAGLLLLSTGVVAIVGAPDERGAPIVVSPRPSPSRAPSPTPTTVPERPLVAVPDLEELVAQVSGLRGLPVLREVRSGLVSETELAGIVAEIMLSEVDPVEIEADGRLLVALRLVPPDIDLLEVVTDLYREQIVGLYVPESEVLYVRAAGAELTPFERFTVAHEIVHALQDQSFGLEDLRDIPDEDSDRALAVLALVEGDAVVSQQLWSFTHQDEGDRADVGGGAASQGSAALGRAPRYVREALAFPYREGGAFARALYERGGFAAIDAAYSDPPSSTAEIYHPERYLADQGPVDVSVTGSPGPGWTDARTYTFGEFDLRELVATLGERTAVAVGTGWAGGVVRGWQRGEDTAVGLGLSFDTAADAAEACDAVPRWYAAAAGGRPAGPRVMSSGADWLAWSCSGLDVRLGLAPDEATAVGLTP